MWEKEGTDGFVPWQHFFHQSDHKRHTATIGLPSPHTEETVEEIVDEVLTEW